MKNIRNKIFSAILTFSALMLVGMATAKAEDYDVFTLVNSQIVCEPATITEAGGTTACYVIGKPQGATDTSSVNGYIMYAYTTDKLSLYQVSKAVPTNTGAVLVKAASGTQKITATDDMPANLKEFSCQYEEVDPDNKKTVNDFGCAVFYTVASASSNAFTASTVKAAGQTLAASTTKVIPDSTYGVVATFYVKLSENIDGIVNECGELCIKAYRVPEATMYTEHKECMSDGIGCGLDTQQTYNQYDCQEVHYQADVIAPEIVPPTGAFASYALLIAGALIAISAIALAKKNNKFNKI